jgi:hypothetical protein
MVISVSTILKFLTSIQWLGSSHKWADLCLWQGMRIQWQYSEASCTFLAAIQAINTLKTFMFSIPKRLHGPSLRFMAHHQKVWEVILLTWSEIRYIFSAAMTAEVNLSKKSYRAMIYMSLTRTRCVGLILSKMRKLLLDDKDTPRVWSVWSSSSYLVASTAVSGWMTFASLTSANSKKMK